MLITFNLQSVMQPENKSLVVLVLMIDQVFEQFKKF